MEHVVTVHEDNSRADKVVTNICRDAGYAFIQSLFRRHRIKVNGLKISASHRLHAGDVVKIFADLSETRRDQPEFVQRLWKQLQRMIIFEHEDFFAINKPPGLAVQSGTKVGMCVDALIKSYPEHRCHLVHRLDKDTSGLLLVAKNQTAARRFTGLFRENKIHKTYLAVVDGLITTSGRIENFLEKSFIDDEEKMRVSESGLLAVTEYRPLKSSNGHTLLELKPSTGRKHQLRVHCADVLDTPILGDVKYHSNSQHRRLFLHAQKIFIEELETEIEAPPPAHFGDWI
ncbi:MAG: RluA family pseudouridine synthase [Holosporaceae bacterium]|jgi:23S rRNA pseudouridine955/2504/2580 synthase|nr:RluA family pseudouridine synthase [Holosporaceae bacterium]